MIAKREKRKKIFYVPGMISLVLIPLFCFYHFYKVDAFKVYGAVDLSIPDSSQEKMLLEVKRNYRKFDFNNPKQQEIKRINDLRFFVRDLVKNDDTINGAKIHFGLKTDYDTFVSIIDLIAEENIQSWFFVKNDIYVLGSAKLKPNKNFIPIITCGYVNVNKDRWEEEQKETERKYLMLLYKQNWILFAGYFGILLLNIFALVKFNKNQNYNQK